MIYAATLLSLLPLLAVAAPYQQNGPGMKQEKQQQGGMSCTPQGSDKAVKVGKAIYILTNDAENAVVALPIGADGKLSAGKMAKTGGAGSAAVDAEGKPEAPDPLASQSSLTVAGNVSLLQTFCPCLTRLRPVVRYKKLTRFLEPLRRERRLQHAHHDGNLKPGPYGIDLRRQTCQSPRRVPQHCCCISKEQDRLRWNHG